MFTWLLAVPEIASIPEAAVVVLRCKGSQLTAENWTRSSIEISLARLSPDMRLLRRGARLCEYCPITPRQFLYAPCDDIFVDANCVALVNLVRAANESALSGHVVMLFLPHYAYTVAFTHNRLLYYLIYEKVCRAQIFFIRYQIKDK